MLFRKPHPGSTQIYVSPNETEGPKGEIILRKLSENPKTQPQIGKMPPAVDAIPSRDPLERSHNHHTSCMRVNSGSAYM